MTMTWKRFTHGIIRSFWRISDIEADWTTTERAVIYRFDFNNNDSCNIIFRSADNADFKISGNNIIQRMGSIRRSQAVFSC